MTLWLRVRQAWAVVLALVALAAAMPLCGQRQLILPTVIGGGATASLWSGLMPIVWAAALGFAFQSKGSAVEARPHRRLAVLDTAGFLVSTAVVVSVFLAFAPDSSSRTGVVAHLLIVSGLSIGLTVFYGASVGIMATTALLLVTSSYSPRLEAARFVRVLQPDGDIAWSLALGILLVAMTVGVLTHTQGAVHKLDE